MKLWRKSYLKENWRPILLLTLLSLLTAGPLVWSRGTDVVTRTYARAAELFWQGQAPYFLAGESLDAFKYSPAFAFLYFPFSQLNSSWHALSWTAFNALFFWWGLSGWVRFSRKNSWFFWAVLIFVSMEVDISLRYQQVNAWLAGVAMLGLAHFRDQSWRTASFLLTMATNFKLLPGLYLLGSFLRLPPSRYIWAIVIFSSFWILLPLLSFQHDFLPLYRSWYEIIFNDIQSTGLLDIRTVMERLSLPSLGSALRILVLVSTLWFFVYPRRKNFSWGLWYGFGACLLLLLSPRTESPTFILVAPLYLFLQEDFESLEQKSVRRLLKFLLLSIIFSITICYTDLWPKSVWNPLDSHYASKTIGTLALWLLVALWSVFRTKKLPEDV